jgi:hypothetical protein
MADGQVIAGARIKHDENGHDGPGYYYQIIDESGNEVGGPVGPFSTQDEAEENVHAAIRIMIENMVREELGLE